MFNPYLLNLSADKKKIFGYLLFIKKNLDCTANVPLQMIRKSVPETKKRKLVKMKLQNGTASLKVTEKSV